MPAPTDINALPLILYDADLCALLDINDRTLQRLRKHGVFQIPELPKLDRRHRYSRRDVEAYLNRESGLTMTRRRA